MAQAVEALAADRQEVLRIGSGLDAAGWDSPSGCQGWSVKDLVAHMGSLFWTVVDLSVLPDTTGMSTEEAAEVWVAARRGMSGAQVLEDYSNVSEQALSVLEVMAGVDDEMALGDLGTYPVRVLPTAFCFDHYTHIRADLFAPRGPLPGPVPRFRRTTPRPHPRVDRSGHPATEPLHPRIGPVRCRRCRHLRDGSSDHPDREPNRAGLGDGALGRRHLGPVGHPAGRLAEPRCGVRR